MVCSTHNTNARIRYQNHVSVRLSVSQVDSQIAPCVIVMLIKTLFQGGSSVRNINAKVSNKSMGRDDSQLRRYAPTRIENQLHSTLMMLNRYLLISNNCYLRMKQRFIISVVVHKVCRSVFFHSIMHLSALVKWFILLFYTAKTLPVPITGTLCSVCEVN